MQLRTLIFLAVSFTFFSCKEATKETNSASEPIQLEAEEATIPVYEDLEGNAVALSDYRGKRILLNYWATWCRPCIEEMPDLLKLQTVLEQENYVFLFASDQSVKKIQAFKTARGFDFKFIKYNGTYPEQQISALPVTLIYNEAGEQVSRFDGGMSWDTPEMIEQLKNIQ
ncbi:TlpA family protein disulfide reductase [Maribacter sp. ACAM166]|uniref:TlpA family protein disulfide reductase n=1 Tax=Maribacter sp. ACAM166 TaxID=2508996 RepID=UPI0010FDE492|nr:TlpA disulfide reductase family protein [Maribacter sp. ACAM166]TLP81439.1 TlpA family protein disulfide reductase [Maribacter sp. ACAM166]